MFSEPWKLLIAAAIPAALWLYRKRLAAGWARRFSRGSMLLRFFRPLAALTAAQMENTGRDRMAGTLLACAAGIMALALAGPDWPNGRLHLAAAALLTVSGVTAWQVMPGRPTRLPVGDPRPVAGLHPGSLSLDTAGPPSGPGSSPSRPPFVIPGGYDPTDRRDYVPGDELRAVDWNATARSGKMIVKLSTVETDVTLWLLVDCSASTRAGVASPKRSLMVQLSVLIARAAAFGDLRLGLVLFTSGVEKVILPQLGKQQADRVARALSTWEVASPATDIPAALAALVKRLDARGTVFVVSDFTEPMSPEFESAAGLLKQKRQKLVAVRVSDPLDEELPDLGPVRLENPETGQAELVDTSDPRFRESYKTAARDIQSRLRARLAKAGVPLIEMRTTDTPARLVERMSRLRREIRATTSG